MDNALTLIFDAVQEQGVPNHCRTSNGPWKTVVQTPPSRQGLDTLMVSGSEQPSLSELAGVIRGFSQNVVVVDLRQESHCLLGEHPVSWYGQKNWANKGKSRAEVEADEGARIALLATAHSATVSRVLTKDLDGELATVRLEETSFALAQSEERAVRSLGLGYQRILVTDHTHPLDADVDEFLRFVRGLAPDTWLHFHCHAGDGRTTTFMVLYDMLRNARVLGLEELAARQYLLGGVDLLHTPHTGWKEPLYNERAAFVGRFYEFARTRDFMAVSWSEHLAG